MSIVIDIPPELEARLQKESRALGIDPPELVRRALESVLPEQTDRNRRALDLLAKWDNEGDEAEQRETLEALKEGLNAHYSSDRKIFP